MKVSFFENSFSIWVDYLDREDCIWVLELEEEEIKILNSWMDYNIIENSIEFFEWQKWKAIQEICKPVELTEEEIKENLIKQYKDLEKKAAEKRSEYLTAELMPESILKNMKLEKLTQEWVEITKQYESLVFELIQEYWEEILLELV